MRVILTEDVPHVGNMGEIVRVSDGYGRNYLIPKGLAMLATEQRTKEFAHKQAVIEHKKNKLKSEALEAAKKIEAVSVKIMRAANDEGKLHGSVTNRDIADALNAKGVEVDRRKIVLDQPIRDLGEYDVEIRLVADVVAKIKVEVAALAG